MMKYPDEFIKIADEVWQSEGDKLVPDDGKDKDGNPVPSYLGILQTTWEWFLELKELKGTYPDSVTEFGDLSIEHRKALFYNFMHWWAWERSGAAGVYGIADWFAYMLADWYVQSGGWAIKSLQKKAGLVGKDVDGSWGPTTSKAVYDLLHDVLEATKTDPFADNDFVKWYDSERRGFLLGLIDAGKQPEAHRAGFNARCDKILRITLEKVETNDEGSLSVAKTIDISEEPDIIEIPIRESPPKQLAPKPSEPVEQSPILEELTQKTTSIAEKFQLTDEKLSKILNILIGMDEKVNGFTKRVGQIESYLESE